MLLFETWPKEVRMFRKLKGYALTPLIILLAAAVCFSTSRLAQAGDWFDRFGSSLVTNQASAWDSQKMGHYSGGGVSFRTPVDRTPFFSVTPPRIEAGCGGIDAFWGGFSFLNVDFLIQKLKNILQAAPAYAFDLALTQLCQTCANILKSLEAIANELNSLALDDCKASQALTHTGAKYLTSLMGIESTNGEDTGGGAGFLTGMLKKVETNLGDFRNELHKFLDYRYGCDRQGSDKDACRTKYTLSGSIWKIALKMANDKRPDFKIDEKYAQLVSALYGDIEFRLPDEVDKANSKAKSAIIMRLPPCQDSFAALVNAMVGTEDAAIPKIMVRTNLETKPECVEVDASTILSDTQFFFGQRAKLAVEDIKTSMLTGKKLENQTVIMINQSVVPIYTALNILNLRLTPKSTTLATAEEKALAQMLAASNALFILTSLHSSALEIMGEATTHISSLMDMGIYPQDGYDKGLIAMRESMNLVSMEVTGKIEEARTNYMQALDSIVKAHSLKTVFHTLLINKMM